MKHLKKNIIISRTDSIGDVILTLPVAKILKDIFPEITIAFLGKNYTRPVIEACKYVDVFISVDVFLAKEILIENEKPEAILHVFPVAAITNRAKQLGIPLRVGTTNRIYNWLNCNELIKLSRRNSDLHEAQLNLQLLLPFGIDTIFPLEEIARSFGLEKIHPLKPEFLKLLHPSKFNLILHPKSQGSAREWGLENFEKLIQSLDKEQFQIFISGTKKEYSLLKPLLDVGGKNVVDISGKMDLNQFISFIHHCDGLVANSTGPLHIAAALGKYAFGIYAPMRPIHPGRWTPIGKNAQHFVLDKTCDDCRKNDSACHCIKEVPSEWIKKALDKAFTNIEI
ncbi:MAG: glycosyltransferase family 9 protein [Bacteroidota bacterium]|nr:glycosyltransferase family 9 protein [Bacteroidota bacterium]